MEEHKQRNRDHIRNKQKYKGKSVKDPKYVTPKSTRHLVSNWDRYEKEIDFQEYKLTSNTDFAILASAPITKGHHFQFKSEKAMAEEIENKTPAELFSLNLNLLKDSICTIPFYNRVGIDSEYFTENQLKFMDKDAEVNLAKYNEKYTEKKVEEPTPVVNNENKDQISVNGIVQNKEEIKQVCVLSEQEEIGIKELQSTQTQSDDDLEQWLDNFLDE